MKKSSTALLALFSILFAVACERAETAGSTEPAPLVTESQAKKTPPVVKTPNPPMTAPTTADGRPGVNPAGAATLEFHKHLEAYLKIHNAAESKVPNLQRTDDPKEISDRERALARMIMTLRAGAQIGDIFAPEYQPYFIKIVHEDFKLRSAADRKALIVELPANMKVDVNTEYPTSIPLATFPPALLRKLPDLPPELEYRIVGRSLILRDVKANLIVDILRNVVPTIPT